MFFLMQLPQVWLLINWRCCQALVEKIRIWFCFQKNFGFPFHKHTLMWEPFSPAVRWAHSSTHSLAVKNMLSCFSLMCCRGSTRAAAWSWLSLQQFLEGKPDVQVTATIPNGVLLNLRWGCAGPAHRASSLLPSAAVAAGASSPWPAKLCKCLFINTSSPASALGRVKSLHFLNICKNLLI